MQIRVITLARLPHLLLNKCIWFYCCIIYIFKENVKVLQLGLCVPLDGLCGHKEGHQVARCDLLSRHEHATNEQCPQHYTCTQATNIHLQLGMTVTQGQDRVQLPGSLKFLK